MPNPTSSGLLKTLRTYFFILFSLSFWLMQGQSNCNPPGEIAIQEINLNSAQVSWQQNENESSWEIVYHDQSNFNPEIEGESIETNSPEIQLTNLLPNTSYTFYVRSLCSDDSLSSFSESFSFNTLCESVNVPLVVDFPENELPECHTQIGEDEYGEWKIRSFGEYSALAFKHRTNTYDSWYFLEGIYLEEGEYYELNYSFWADKFPSITENLRIGISKNPSLSAVKLLKTHSDIPDTFFGNPSEAEHGSLIFSVEETGVYYLGFNAAPFLGHNNPNSTSNFLYLGEIEIDVAPSCIVPQQIWISEITTDSAEFHWNPISHNFFEVAYGKRGFDLDDPEFLIEIEDDDMVLLENLESGIYYDVFVRAKCSNDEESVWSEKKSFVTACTTFEVPFSFDFDNTIDKELPHCSEVENNAGYWITKDLDALNLPGRGLSFQPPNDQADSWFFTPGIYLEQGNYSLNFLMANPYIIHFYNYKSISIHLGTSANSESMEVKLKDYPEFRMPESQDQEVSFNISEDGIYYLGFYNYSKDQNGQLYISSIQLDFADQCVKPSEIEYSNLTETTVDINWMNPVPGQSSMEVVYAESGMNLSTQGTTVETTENHIHLDNLNPNTSYNFYIRTKCSDSEFSEFSDISTFTTLCEEIQIPFYEDFSVTGEFGIPECSTLQNEGDTGEFGNWKVVSELFPPFNNYSNKKLKYELISYYDNNPWYFTRGIALKAGVNYKINYRYGGNGLSLNLNVSYGKSPEAFAMNVLKNSLVTSKQQLLEDEKVFSVEEDGTYYFGFNTSGNYGNFSELFLLDFDIDLAPCIEVSELTTEKITSTTAKINWNSDGLLDPELEIIYGAENFDPTQGGTSVTIENENSIVLENLSPDTTYDVYVKVICNSYEEGIENPQFLTFSTMCEVNELPFFENFEDLDYPEIPDCTRVDLDGVNSWKTSSEENILFFDTTSQTENWFFTPNFEMQEGKNYQLILTHSQEGNYQNLEIAFGKYSEKAAMEDLIYHSSSISGGEAFESRTDTIYFQIPESAKYVLGFNAFSNYGEGKIIIDEMEISEAASCLPPSEIVENEVTHKKINIHWVAQDTSSGWNVKYQAVDENHQPLEEITEVNLSSPQIELNDLEANTIYKISIASICTDENSIKKDFFITTTCESEEVPFFEGFEDEQPWICDSYEQNDYVNNWEIIPYNNNDFEGNSLSLIKDDPTTVDLWYFTKGIFLEEGKVYELKYLYNGNADYFSVHYGRANKSEAMTEEINEIYMASQYVSFMGKSENIFQVEESGVYYFGFHAITTDRKIKIYLDNIEVDEAADCIRPMEIIAENVTSESADISWVDYNNGSVSWEVIYGIVNFDPETEGTTVIVDDNPELQLNNLPTDYSYDVYVRAICSESNNEFSEFSKMTFGTLCLDRNHLNDDFEGPHRYCWKRISNSVFASGFSSDEEEAFSGEYFYRFPAMETEYLISPELQGLDEGNTVLKFKFRSHGQNPFLIVGVMDDPTDKHTFYPIEEINNISPVYKEHQVFLSESYTQKHIAFKYYSNFGEAFLDDVIWESSPDYCPVPVNLELEDLTRTSAKISWESPQDVNEWEVKYGEQGFDPVTDGTLINVDEPKVNVTGLTTNTEYQVYVRSVCASGESDFVFFPLKFATLCEPQDLPFFEDFEDVAVGQIPPCSRVEASGYGTPWSVSLIPDIINNPGDKALQIVVGPAGGNEDWFFLNGLNLEAGVNYSLDFEYYAGNFNGDAIQIAIGDSPIGSKMTNVLLENNYKNTFQIGFKDERIIFNVETDGVYYIGFRFFEPGGFSHSFFLNNISIAAEENCLNPEIQDAEIINGNTAKISWMPGVYDSSWEIFYGEPGFEPNEAESVLVEGNSEVFLTDLNENSTYEVLVKANCGVEEDEEYWSDSITFSTTEPSCERADAIILSEIGTTFVKVLLSDSNFNPTWEIYYRKSNESWDDTIVINTDSFENLISDLEPDTEYYLGVKTFCANELDSNLLLYLYFTTATVDCHGPTQIELDEIGATTLKVSWNDDPFVNKWFISYGPEGFIPDVNGTTLVVQGSSEIVLENLIPETNYEVYLKSDCQYYGESDWTTPGVFVTEELSCSSPDAIAISNLTQTSALINWNSNGNESQWEIVVGDNDTNPDEEEITATISDSEFMAENLEPDSEYVIFVRSICAETESADWTSTSFITESYPAPNGLSIDVDGNSITVNWNSEEDVLGWAIVYGIEGFDPATEGETLIVGNEEISSLPFSKIYALTSPSAAEVELEGLEPNTAYDLYLAAIMEDGFWSEFAGPVNFTTGNMSVFLPEFLNFSFFPNPFEGKINLNADKPIEEVRIYNLLGQLILKEAFNQSQVILHLETIPAGVYFMDVQIQGSSKRFKILKKI